MRRKDWKFETKFAIIEVPAKAEWKICHFANRKPEETDINASRRRHCFQFTAFFSYFGYDDFKANSFKVTKDAEFDLDNDIRTSFVEKIEKESNPEEKENLPVLFLTKTWINLWVEFLIKNSILPKRQHYSGSKIHNFRHLWIFQMFLKL